MAFGKVGKYLRDLMIYRSININIEIIRFESAVKRMFREWEKQIQDRLVKRYTIKSLIEKALNKKEIEAIARIKLGSHPKRLATISQAVAQKGLEHSYMDINAVLSWDINMSPLADFYVSHYKTFTDKISQNLQDRIKSEIALGVRDGTPYPELSKKVSKIFSKPIPVHVAAKLNRKGEVIRRAYDYNMDNRRWSDMVARTETQRALNNGRVYGYQQSNTAKTLRWVANPGACPDCSFRSGEIYKVEEAQDLIPLHPECLISGKVYIYTSKEWKHIKDIKVNDYVLTHKGRFKKVTNVIRTPKQIPEVVEIKFKKRKLTVTDNHPVLVNGKWILAKEIKKGDIVKLLAGECKRCKKDIYKFIDVKIESVKKWKIEKPRMLYNLTVEEDESYVAKGFVVHNCRCTWIVEEYKTFEEAEKGIKSLPDKFADPEKIYSDPNGMHIMDFFKGTLDEKDFKLIEITLEKGVTTKALKSLKKLKTTKVNAAEYVKKYPTMLEGTPIQKTKFLKGLEPLPMEHVKPIYSIDIVDSLPGYVAGFHNKGYITMAKFAKAKDIAHEVGHNFYKHISAEFKSEFIKYAMPYHVSPGKATFKTVSSYAKKNVNEHFCENYMFYYHNPEILKKAEPSAFKIFNKYLKEYE